MKSAIAFTSLVSAASTIPTIELGDSGVKAPMVVVGTFQLNETEAYTAVRDALDVGFTGAHCDWTYFNMPGCGRALKEAGVNRGDKRKDFYLQASVAGNGFFATKLPKNVNATEATTIQIEQTLKELDVDYLDHLFIHMPPMTILGSAGLLGRDSCKAAEDKGKHICDDIMAQWSVMEDYYSQGKIRSLGVSNFCPSCFDCMQDAKVKPVLNQLQSHIGWGVDPLGAWTVDKKRNVVTQAYSPLGHGSKLDPEVLHGNLTAEIAAAYGKSTAELALKWLVSNNIPLAVQSTNKKHLASDMDLWSWDLSAEHLKALNEWESTASQRLGKSKLVSWACQEWTDEETTVV